MAWISRLSGPTHGGSLCPSLRVQLVGYPWYQISSGSKGYRIAESIDVLFGFFVELGRKEKIR
jgi:hypothetical protein